MPDALTIKLMGKSACGCSSLAAVARAVLAALKPAPSAWTKPGTCKDPEVRWSEGAESRQHLEKLAVEVHKPKETLKFEV